MPVKQSNDVCVEPVETSDSFDKLLILRHLFMISIILDFVKYYRLLFL